MYHEKNAYAARCCFLLALGTIGVAQASAQQIPERGDRQSARSPANVEFPKIDRHPAPARWNRQPLTELPAFDPSQARNPWQVDLRQRDVSGLALRDRLNDLLNASFDEGTTWPPATSLPAQFNPAQIMEIAKNPGLGIRSLHQNGITGRGVGIGIIDQTLLVDHPEYVDRLRLYEETDCIAGGWLEPQMHGAAVASLAVGKSIGTAPEADLYYIATARGGDGKDFAVLARCIRRLLAVNQQLPADRKIRVIAMAIGWGPRSQGHEDVTAAAREAREAGMLVICSSIEQIHGFRFHGLGRPPLADPEQATSYEPGAFWAAGFRANPQTRPGALLIPMDSRTTAAFQTSQQYVFYRHGGWSWAIPYIAGLYALAAQTDPAITPQRFWNLALSTGDTIQLRGSNGDVALGPIVDPPALIEAVRSGVKPKR